MTSNDPRDTASPPMRWRTPLLSRFVIAGHNGWRLLGIAIAVLSLLSGCAPIE